MDKQVRSAQGPHSMPEANLKGPDAAGQNSRIFFRHSLYRLLDHIWLLVVLAIIGGILGIIMGYSTYNRIYEKEFSVNIGLRTDSMVSGHEAAASGVALLDDVAYAQRVRALLSFDMRLLDCQQAISITNPTETDVITFVVRTNEPDRTRELAQAARAVADNILSEMPQVGKLQWHDGQYEIRDIGRSLALQTIFIGVLFALIGLAMGIAVSFLLILFDTRIHFVDEEGISEELHSRALLRRTIVNRHVSDTRKLLGQYIKTSKLQKRRTSAFLRRKAHIRPAAPLPAQEMTTDASIRLFAAQMLLNMPESKEDEPRGATLMLLPSSPVCDYIATFVSVIASFAQIGERVMVADFTPDLLLSHPSNFPGLHVDFFNWTSTSADSLNAYREQIRGAISSYDITIALFSEFSLSGKELSFLEACEHIVPCVLLHKTKLLDFKRLTNQIRNTKKEIDRVAFISNRDTDFKRSIL
ncbi:MAG: hypothetical protein AAGU74_02145 [Bacillota bacterium]